MAILGTQDLDPYTSNYNSIHYTSNMPKAPKKGAMSQRKVRFSEEELNMLADTLAENEDIVFVADLRRLAQLKKKEIWEEVAQKVSAVGTTPRTVKEFKKHWDDLRLRVRNILSANRSQGLATGIGPNSPIKMTRWDETCASTIGMEAIERVGDMERGAPSSADGGSDSDSDAQDSAAQATTPLKNARGRENTNRPSTSKGPGKAHQPLKAKAPQDAKALGRQRASTTATVLTTGVSTAEEPVADGALSAANSSVGEAAATAPLSDDKEQTHGEVCVLEDDVSSELHGTPSPRLSPQLTQIITPTGTTHEQSGGESGPECWSPTEDKPELGPLPDAPSTSTGVRDGEWRMAQMEKQQEELIGLVRQYVSDGALTRQVGRENTAAMKDAIESSTTRI
ncbi:myb-related transcription factor, partner of profilin-like [Ambystoma mexicanum]|uniref:myb-related transcription factor, partner of profilin-like n=1 Tax=Ambystoma mexicanum TaxID=8296 RepID=UPI0037E8D9E3